MALDTNLVAYWKYDESSGNASDSTGNGSTLTNNGSIPYVSGKINNGADLENSGNDYFSVADNSFVSVTGDFSFSFWANFEGFTGSMSMAKWNDADNSQNSYQFKASQTELRLGVRNSSDTQTSVSVAASLSTSTWYYFIVTYNSSSGATKFYQDGSQLGTTQTSATGGPKDTATSLVVGRDAVDGTNYYDGIVDEMGMWSRELSSSEVTELYNGGNGLAYPFPSGHKFITLLGVS